MTQSGDLRDKFQKFTKVAPKAVAFSGEELVRTSSLNDAELPLVLQPATEDVDLVGWAHANTAFLDEKLRRHGAILFRGFGLASVNAFEAFAAAICPNLFGEYGDLPREAKGERVYKSTPYPNDKTILFHNESSHMHRWPMMQWFYCVTPSREGGETPIVDCRRIYSQLAPEVRQRFADKGLMYVRHFVEGLDVSWQDFFRTDDRSAVEEYCHRADLAFEWTPEGSLRTRQTAPAVMVHPKTGETVFFNQIQLHHAACLDPGVRESLEELLGKDGLPRSVCYGDGMPIEDSLVQHILDLYWQNAVQFPWQEGDILMVDNMLTAHARNPFQGERKIVVAMGELFEKSSMAA
ncbi:MAG: TauD/TfdA family dioxygenase [Thermoanaerobaculia bacterium]